MPITLQKGFNLEEASLCNAENVNALLANINDNSHYRFNVEKSNLKDFYPLFWNRLAEVNPDAEVVLHYEGDEPTAADAIDFAEMLVKAEKLILRKGINPPSKKSGAYKEFLSLYPHKAVEDSLDAFIKEKQSENTTFADTLSKLVAERNLTDSEVYKRSNVSRQTWNKIFNEGNYLPSKQTILAYCVGLKLNIVETKELLRTAGYALTDISEYDLIVEYFIVKGIYDMCEINTALADRGLPNLGSTLK